MGSSVAPLLFGRRVISAQPTVTVPRTNGGLAHNPQARPHAVKKLSGGHTTPNNTQALLYGALFISRKRST